jgi:hypothetical protein
MMTTMANDISQTPLVTRNHETNDRSFSISTGAQIVQAARARQRLHAFGEVHTLGRNNMVELLSDSGAIVGFAYIDNSIKTNMELNGSKLFPLEVAVRITEVRDESHWTGEVVGEVLGLCVGLIIRWNRLLARVVHNSSITSHTQCEVESRMPTLQTRATIFDFHDQFNSPGSNDRA